MSKNWFLWIGLLGAIGCTSEQARKVQAPNPNPTTPVSYSVEVSEYVGSPFLDEEAAKKEYAQINASFKKSIEDLRELIGKTKSKQEQAELLMTRNPAPVAAAQFLRLAKKYPDTDTAVNAILFAVGQTKGVQKDRAMCLLLKNYSDKVEIRKIAASLLKEIPSPAIENWFQLMIENTSSDADKANAIVTYARYVGRIPFFKRSIELSEGIAERLPAKQLDYINADRSESQNKQLATMLQTVIDDYADIRYKGRKTYGEVATSELFDLQRLQVGMVAPDIEGKDLDEIPFKLSDYRGKVVMLDFWGHWCPPCRAMYGHEQQITRKLADKPFVLLGVNSDSDLQDARDAVSGESLSWRHFWNGPQGTRGPISTQWNVEDWPTVYLIDHEGVIRYKTVLGEDIDRGIEQLMADIGHEVDLKDSAE